MVIEQDQRRFPRLSITGQDYAVRFQVKGLDIDDCRLVNLSEGGCGLEVQMAVASHVEVGDVLEHLFLDHPDLPLVPLSATVLRMLGKVPGKISGYVLMGTEFQQITPFVRALIAGHVKAQLSQEGTP